MSHAFRRKRQNVPSRSRLTEENLEFAQAGSFRGTDAVTFTTEAARLWPGGRRSLSSSLLLPAFTSVSGFRGNVYGTVSLVLLFLTLHSPLFHFSRSNLG